MLIASEVTSGQVSFTPSGISRYDTRYVEIYSSARKHGINDSDIEHAMAVGEQDDGKVLYLGPDSAGNLLEIVTVLREDDTEIVIHAMRMRRNYGPFLRQGSRP